VEIIKGKQVALGSNLNHQYVVLRKLLGQYWLKSSLGWVKLNCDGSFKPNDGSAGGCMVLRDDDGKVIFQHAINCNGPLEAESRACEEGLKLALHWSDKPVVVELDYSVGAIKYKNLDRSPLAHLIVGVEI
jgi:hypothetical protein